MLEFFNELEINTQKLQNNVNEEANRSSINNNDRNKINQTRQNWTQKLNEILTLNKNAINQLINENANREQMRFAVKYNSIYIKNGSIRDNEIRHKCPIGILFIYENDFNFVPNNPNYFK